MQPWLIPQALPKSWSPSPDIRGDTVIAVIVGHDLAEDMYAMAFFTSGCVGVLPHARRSGSQYSNFLTPTVGGTEPG